MIVEEDDLERAGTRSRRQLTNSKQYATYPPKFNSKKQDNMRRFFYNKSRSILIALVLLIMVITLISNSTFTKLNTTKRKPKVISFEDTAVFLDSTQFTDYAHLNRLLSDKKETVPSGSNSWDLSIEPSQNPFVHQLAKGLVIGHTFDELRRLTNNVALSMTNKHRRVPVTAMIHTTTVTQLYVQVQAVLTQTTLPEHVWIICDTENKAEVEARIMTLDRRHVKIMVQETQNHLHWLQTAKQIATDFVWIIDRDVAPGKRYLENLLKLSHTPEYQSALLGTEGAVITNNTVECLPNAMYSSSRQMKSQVVDVINDSWLLHRTWIPGLLNALERHVQTSTPLAGLFISQTLYLAGIPSVALPTDPIERAYWGDVRLKKAQKSETCKSLETLMNTASLEAYKDMLNRNTTLDSVLFFVDSSDQLEQLGPLICKFNQNKTVDLHIMTTDVSYKTTCAIDGSFHPIDLTDNQHISHLIRIMTAIQPKILVHTVNPTSNTFKSIDTASKSLAITHIYLPTQDIPHTLWMTELPLDTLSKWHDFTVNIMVNTDKKPHALARLLTSVTNAHYLGDQVDLTVLLDYSSDQITQTFANNFVWNKGEKNIRHRISQATKASVFVESWYPSSHDEYAIILNNDAELSEYFYVWVKYAILRYRYTERDNSLFGISLYTPRLLETDPSGRHFFSANYQLKKANRTGQVGQPYRMQWPGYSGAVYFPEHWREFHDYITARHADLNGFEMQDVVVPGLRSNEWTKSWRRFMEELIYLRGYVMLFPNFPSSLSTVHIELRKKAMREQFQDAVSLYNVPLMQQDLISSGLVLPDLRTLPIFDIWGQLSDIEELQERGLELHEETSSCLPSIDKEDLFDPTDLLCPFSRIKSVTLANENDSLPELSPIDVTIYT